MAAELQFYNGSAWKSLSGADNGSFFVYNGSAWKPAHLVYVYDGTTWVLVAAIGPLGPPTGAFISVNGFGQVELNWTAGDMGAGTKVFRDSILITTLAATIQTYNTGDLDPSPFIYEIAHSRNGLDTANVGF